MKKVISIIATVFLLLSFCGLTVSASITQTAVGDEITDNLQYVIINSREPITLSEDYKKLYCGEDTYTRFSSNDLTLNELSDGVSNKVVLSDAQKKEISEVLLCATSTASIINAEIYFKDGAVFTASFLNDNFTEEYNRIIKGECEEYIIDFAYPADNTVTASRELIFGQTATLNLSGNDLTDWYYVKTQASDKSFTVEKGMLLVYSEQYYYADFTDKKFDDNDFWREEKFEVTAHLITDTDLLKRIEEAQEKYYGDDFGFFDDDKFTKAVANVFLIIIFAIIPFAILVLFTILALRSKGIYRKMFTAICVLSAIELLVFAIVNIILFK